MEEYERTKSIVSAGVVTAMGRNRTQLDHKTVVTKLNQMLNGWANYCADRPSKMGLPFLIQWINPIPIAGGDELNRDFRNQVLQVPCSSRMGSSPPRGNLRC
jgi:hypothetical protein